MDQWVESLQPLVGCELRQFRYNEKSLQLQLAGRHKTNWLTFSMKPGNPFVFLTSERIPLAPNLKKPMGLFLKTHFLGSQLSAVSRNQRLGRVVDLNWNLGGETLCLQFSLIPGRVNLQAQVGAKTVYTFKPEDFPENLSNEDARGDRELREPELFLLAWTQLAGKGVGREIDGSSGKELKKKKSGLLKMQEHLHEMQNSPWSALGQWLKSQQTLQGVPEDWASLVDHDQDLAWNIEHCFKMAKKNHSKIEGTKERLMQLHTEIEALESGQNRNSPSRAAKTPSLLNVAQLKGKTVTLPEGRIFIGKSGSDNLKLLRKAKAWYYWLHIKDYPGAYGILERNKGQKISLSSLEKAAEAVILQSLPQGATGVFDALYAECRYVRPIKGAKAGQVTYSHEKVLSVRVGE